MFNRNNENFEGEIERPVVEYDSDEIREMRPEEIHSRYENRNLAWYDAYTTEQLKRFRDRTTDPFLLEQYNRVIAQREQIEDDETRELPQNNEQEEEIDREVQIDDNNEDMLLTRLAGNGSNPEVDFFGTIFEVDEENIEEVAGELRREAMLRSLQVNMPLFLFVKVKDNMDLHASPQYYAVRFNPQNFDFLVKSIKEPYLVWDLWREQQPDFASDYPALVFVDEETYRLVDARGMRPGCFVVTHMGFYNYEDVGLNVGGREFLYTPDFARLWRLLHVENKGYLRRKGRFMKYVMDYNKVLKSETPIAKFWRNVKIQEEMAEKFQIPWFIHDDLLSEPMEGGLPCLNPIFATPCFLYALKTQVPKGIYEQIENLKIIHGIGVSTSVFSTLYKEFKIEFHVKRIWRNQENNSFKVNTDVLPKRRKEPGIYIVKMLLWEEHYMIDAEYEIDGKMFNFIRILEETKEQGLISIINAYDFARLYDNFAYDEMLHFNYKEFIKNTPCKHEFTNNNYDKLVYKEKCVIPDIWFADFEASTDEKYHIPYLIVAVGNKVKVENERLVYKRIKASQFSDEAIYWGKDCAEHFLDKLLNLYGTQSKTNKLRTACRVYFHNLHYDFTFILCHLYETKQVRKGNTLYSVKGIYKKWGKKVKIDFWDSLPIFQCTLKKAAETYLTSRQKQDIKKEVFPYKLYTYDFFEIFNNGTCSLDLAIQALPENQKEEFKDVVLKGDFLTENGDFKYRKYAEFYCKQDVNCLEYSMKNFADLLFGRSIEGINGCPPFSLILWQYRTASSIGYEYFLRTVMFKKENNEYIPRYDWCIPKCELRALIQLSIRGGRTMVRDNARFHYIAKDNEGLLQDYDFVSLYPTAMSKLWITEGPPMFIKADPGDTFNRAFFEAVFRRPEDDDDTSIQCTDGIIHLIYLYTPRKLHFPMICVKDKKTGLNNYKNFDEEVDIWVNAIDVFNLIDFQYAQFKWDAAVVWTGKRRYEIRDSIKNLFDFRANNKKHPVQLVTKLMMNSIFGKSILKPNGKQKLIIDEFKYRKQKEIEIEIIEGQQVQKEIEKWVKVDNWAEYFRANAYRINKIQPLPFEKVEVEIFVRDVSSSLNIFGSDVLAMARRIIGRVMAMAEECEDVWFNGEPNLFYTDTDSMHITNQLLKHLEEKYENQYHEPLKGRYLGNCHEDFDPPENFKPGEYVLGACESYFLMKKVYVDKLIGSQGSIGYHIRMKGIPTNLVHFEDYEKIFNGENVEFDLLNGHTRFYYKDGHVGSRLEFKRKIGLKRKNNE